MICVTGGKSDIIYYLFLKIYYIKGKKKRQDDVKEGNSMQMRSQLCAKLLELITQEFQFAFAL